MSIYTLEIYSNSVNPIMIKPPVVIDGLLINIMPGSIEYDGKKHEMTDPITIQIPKSPEASYVKIYFVEDLENNDILVVPDIFAQPSIVNEWVPDPKKHKIIHVFMNFEVPANTEKLDDLNIFIYNINLPT